MSWPAPECIACVKEVLEKKKAFSSQARWRVHFERDGRPLVARLCNAHKTEAQKSGKVLRVSRF